MIVDVGEQDFQELVIDRSAELPVVVDFWADWCGPCKALTPLLERATTSREGKVDLAKVDVDANQRLAVDYRVQGIPAVKAFRDREVAGEFTGAIPGPQVEEFFDSIVPSEADQLVSEGGDDEESLRRALELDPRHAGAAVALARLLLGRGDPEGALAVVEPLGGDFLATGLAARARLQLDGAGALEAAFTKWDEGDRAAALESLQEALREADDDERRDLIRQVMVAIFTELGSDDPVVQDHRRRLAAALY